MDFRIDPALPVAVAATSRAILINPCVPAADVAELIALAKSRLAEGCLPPDEYVAWIRSSRHADTLNGKEGA